MAMLTVNPATASLMLSEFVDLKPGDWVMQNVANSGVGGYLVQLARQRGLRTVNVVRREGAVGGRQGRWRERGLDRPPFQPVPMLAT
jgi:trans-2-enoyl-CoA reductase